MVKKSSYDDLETDYFDEEAGGSFLSLISITVAFLAVAAFIALAWYAYQDDSSNGTDELETIYASEGEVRTAPEGESGWQFPDTERQVYNLGSGDVEDMTVEQILPQPTRPDPRVQPETAQTEGWMKEDKTASDDTIGLTDAERRKMEEIANANVQETPEMMVASQDDKVVEPIVTQAPAEEVKAEPAPVAEVAVAPVAPEPAVVEKKVEPKPAPTPVVTKSEPVQPKAEPASAFEQDVAAPATGGLTSNRLQLGAFGSRSEALKNWGNIQSASGSLLTDKRAHVESADVNGKTYFRVQAYPFASKSAADALCVMLKARDQACFSVQR